MARLASLAALRCAAVFHYISLCGQQPTIHLFSVLILHEIYPYIENQPIVEYVQKLIRN